MLGAEPTVAGSRGSSVCTSMLQQQSGSLSAVVAQHCEFASRLGKGSQLQCHDAPSSTVCRAKIVATSHDILIVIRRLHGASVTKTLCLATKFT